jgi:acyl-CoA synthetase (AMP-forming)/AMP-acid ligase II
VSLLGRLDRPLAWLTGRRLRQMEALWRDPLPVQEKALRALVARAGRTAWGREHGFRDIRGVADYQRRVPATTYLEMRPFVERAIAGERDVLWPGRPKQYCKTSGTTAGDKYIPVTPEAFRAHRRGGLDALLLAAHRVGAPALDGPLLFLGGSTHTERLGHHAEVGDLSGLAARRLPAWIRPRYAPGPEIAAIPDWGRRLAATATRARQQDVRLISGMPSWMLVLFERIRSMQGDPVLEIGRLWPHLAVFIHGGVRMEPYWSVFEATVGRPIEYLEVYPASEAFVAIQVEAHDKGLTLMLDYGIFYEFVPVAELGFGAPRRLTIAEVRIDEPYAILLSSPAGLWSYVLGDTVRFVSLAPPQLVITGRTRHFVNAFGENVIVEEVERAAAAACARTRSELVEFTVAPFYPRGPRQQAGHEWAIEFRSPPSSLDGFAHAVDDTLQALNTDYRTKRAGDIGMALPRVVSVAPGSFHRWLATHNKLGDQYKVPRASNQRDVIEAVLVAAGSPESARETAARLP